MNNRVDMVFGRSFGSFVLSFFGFYRGKGQGQPPYRRSRASTLIGVAQLTALILLRVYLCEEDPFNATDLNIFSFIFIYIDTYGISCIVFLSLSVILLKGDRISRILNETCAILAGMNATFNDKHFAVGYVFLVFHLTASSTYVFVCLFASRQQCSNCTFTGIVFCVHCLMIVFLFCLLILSVRDVIAAVNGRLSSSGTFASGEVRALEMAYRSACDLADELNLFFTELNLIITFIAFIMTVNVFSLLFLEEGVILTNICWFFMYSIDCVLTVISCCGFYTECYCSVCAMDESPKFEWGPFFGLLRVSGIISCRETSAGTMEQSKFWEFYSFSVVALVTLLKIFLCFSGGENWLQGFFRNAIWWLDWHGTYLLNLVAVYWVVLKRLKTSATANEIIAISGSLPEEDSLTPVTLHLSAYVIISVSSLVLYYSSYAIPGVEMDSHFSCIFIMTLFTYMDLMVDVFYDAFMINLKYIFEKLNRTLFKTRVVTSGVLFRLRIVHHRCVDVADSISNCFCVSLFAKIVEEFFILVEDLYAIVWAVDHDQALIRTIFWTLLYVFKFSTRVYSSAKVKAEAEKTATYLHELFIENDDPQVREEIEIFSLQLLHRRVQFDACGFFKLDFTLLNSMIGAVTTYIVILIQFQIAGKNTCAATNTTVHTNEILQLADK